ncbi:Hexagonal wall protein [uncultured Oscillibacter sp.]|uniref:S-layer homology domain-containing protein n=1 Tax=Oscillibacter acetigenes TaxID=2981792 RepID=UPI000820C971|nr:S-layer homology domain-containing protein [Oscillibacter acetigenes]MCU6751657.1 S-layer homology domain-containing protein [Oscillibacter acetigenes]SCJ90011.1 Hexagonal wall protein [uncultured Oscillibacter sp.]
MKKFLSLVLALVMTMSLVTVSAGAKDFTDDSEITYKEAVDVISALGVVDGYSDGDFRPDDVLTRGAAAKIICNLILGPTTASALSAGTAPFKDVPVTNTFAGYITYCSQQGIISGYADGTFRPTGTLSGNAFMKMLLGALGYDSSIEGYTGANWQVSVIKQASGIGLDDGNDEFVGSQAVTRQEAALYAFNMLQATMVEYDKKDTIVVGDITINTTSTRKDVENNTNTDGNIDGERNGDGLMQFGEKYFKDLEKEDATDIFGHPSSKWVYDGDDVGTYANEADATYVVEDDDMDVGQVVTSSSYMNYSSSEAKDAKYFLNGDDNEVKSSELVAVGDIVEAYENDNGDVETVVVSRYTVAKIDKVDTDVSTAESRNGASEVLTLTDLDGDNSNDYYDKYDDAEKTLRGYASSYDEGSVLAVAFRDGKFGDEVLASYEAEAVTGEVTAFREDETVTMDGTKYEFARSKDGTDGFVDGITKNFDFDKEYTIYLTADGYVIGVEGAAGADLNDVYYVTGVYCEESRYNANKFTWYAQAVSLADGSASDIELDETDADNALKSIIDDASKDAFTDVKGLYTFDDDIATAWDGDRDYTVYGIDEDDGLDTSLKNALAMDDTKFSTTGGSSKTFYVDENTQYLGVDDYADDIDTVYAMGGMKAGTSGNVIVIADQDEDRDALYVILVDSSASVGSADILYAAGSSTDKVGTDKYVREFWSMEDNTSEDITIDEKLSAHGFYEVDSIDEDGVYTLKDYDKTASSIDEDSDGIVVEDLALDNTDQIYRNALSGSIDNVKFDDVSIANATIIDGRSNSDRNDSVYDREINSISRLEAALDAVRDEDLETKGTVEIDLYVKDGEITFICVTDVGGVAKDDGEQESGELDLTGVENFVCNSNIVTVDLVGTGKIPANYPVTVTLMKANSTEGDAEVGSKEHVNETAYEVNDWNNLGQIAIQESGNYYVIITIENEDGRVVDEFTSNTVRFVYTAQP